MPWPLDDKNVGTGLPLEGIRVLDFSRVLAGPLVGMILGDLGADVIKVENPKRPDMIRSSDPLTFEMVNQGKQSVAADLTDPATRDRLVALIRGADMVIEASRPRALRAFR